MLVPNYLADKAIESKYAIAIEILNFILIWGNCLVPAGRWGIKKCRGTKPYRLQGTTKRPCTGKTKPDAGVMLCLPLYISKLVVFETGRATQYV